MNKSILIAALFFTASTAGAAEVCNRTTKILGPGMEEETIADQVKRETAGMYTERTADGKIYIRVPKPLPKTPGLTTPRAAPETVPDPIIVISDPAERHTVIYSDFIKGANHE